jgi:hypothetical protein
MGETIDLAFEAESRNTCSSSPCAWCRPHTASPDLSIVRPSSTRPVLDHPNSSAPSLLLLPRSSSLPAMPHLSPTQHETSKHISPHETDSREEPPKFLRFKFKSRQVNYSSQIKPRTTWFLNNDAMSGSSTPGTTGHRLWPKILDTTGSLQRQMAGEPHTSYRIRPHHSRLKRRGHQPKKN